MTNRYDLLQSLLLLSALLLGTLACKQEDRAVRTAVSAGDWPEKTRTSKPWTRWWWMGSAVDKENLSRLLKAYEEAGLGGLEIAPIYGAKGFEDRFLPYLSPEWMEMLHHTVATADSLELGIDLTQGTGWPFGGPMVEPEMAAQRMVMQQHTYSEAEGLDRPILLEDTRAARLDYVLHTVMAYKENESPVNLTDQIDDSGKLSWSATGTWKLIAVFRVQTGQRVKRAAPGGQGFTLDHYSYESVGNYLSHFDSAFGENFPGIRAFYNDSFEVYGADFTQDFFRYFLEKRGYDLRDYLPELLAEEPAERSSRVKSDYRETIHDMLLENFTGQWTDWANQRGKMTKNQAHGSPGNLLDLYARVDIPEGETFGSSYFPIPGIRRDSADIRNVDPDPIMLKFASSAAHLRGKNLVSTETFTWLGEHFKSAFSQAKPELEQAFLAGINHMFYHGVTYSPEEVDFPGWLFYASLNLNTHNSLWPHFRGFNEYIQRVQSVLQSGTPDNELLMYWPVYDVWADPEGVSKMLTVHGIDEWLHPTPFYKGSKLLMEKGYSLDFVSDALIEELQVTEGQLSAADGAYTAQVLVVPGLRYLPLATLERLLSLAESGATVVFQEQPADVPGFKDYAERREALERIWKTLSFETSASTQVATFGKGKVILSEDLLQGMKLAGLERETLVDQGIRFIRRNLAGERYYYLVNHTAETIATPIPLNQEGEAAVLMAPEQGKVGLAETRRENGKLSVRVHLEPGESLIVHVLRNEGQGIPNWHYRVSDPEIRTLESPWKLTFHQGGPALPKSRQLQKIGPWTESADTLSLHFSGQARYETSLDLNLEQGARYELSLGKVRESARVWINGQEVGFAFGIPFRLDVGDYLKDGINEITVEVANLMANRIRYLDQQGVTWRNYHEINFVNIDYQPFDASSWEVMPSGLVGPVTLEIHH